MQIKYLCVLIHIRIKGEVGTDIMFKYFFNGQSKAVLLLLILFVILCMVVFVILSCHAFYYIHCSHVIACWERADLLVLLCVMFTCVFVTFPYGVPGKVWYLIVSIPDLYLLMCFVEQTLCIYPHDRM